MEVNALAPSPDRRAARSRLFPCCSLSECALCLHNVLSAELLAGIIIHIIIIILTQMLADNEASERSRCAEK